MATVRVRIVESGILRLRQGPVRRYMLRLGNRVLNNARGKVNVDTGYLRSSGEVVATAFDTVRVAFRARYARFVHDGWRHRTDSGRYRGNPYLRDAMKEEIRR